MMLVYCMVIGQFYGYLVCFVAIINILWLIGIFFPFWHDVPRKIWQPCMDLINPNYVRYMAFESEHNFCLDSMPSVSVS
jgi:hypothetical protein